MHLRRLTFTAFVTFTALQALAVQKDDTASVAKLLPQAQRLQGLSVDKSAKYIGQPHTLSTGGSARKLRSRLSAHDGKLVIDVLITVFQREADASKRFADIQRTVSAPSLLRKTSTTGARVGDECWFHGNDHVISFRLGRVFVTVIGYRRSAAVDRIFEAMEIKVAKQVERQILHQPAFSLRKA